MCIMRKLKKAIYGLKQSSRAWLGKQSGALLSFGFKQSHMITLSL